MIRVYGVADDPKAPVSGWNATWLAGPCWTSFVAWDWTWEGLARVARLGMDPVERGAVSADDYRRGLGMCTLAHTHEQRVLHCALERAAAALPGKQHSMGRQCRLAGGPFAPYAGQLAGYGSIAGHFGADVRPLLVHAPGVGPLAETGRALEAGAQSVQSAKPTEAAHLHYAASLFYAQTGLAREAEQARDAAFGMVQAAVQSGAYGQTGRLAGTGGMPRWLLKVQLASIWEEMVGYTSLCLDWGGTVLNVAVN